MNRKIQISAVFITVIAIAIWAYSGQQKSPVDKNTSVSTPPAAEVTASPPAVEETASPPAAGVTASEENTGYEILANFGDVDLSSLKLKDDETLKETVATYTNSDGQQIKIIVTSGAESAGIVPVN